MSARTNININVMLARISCSSIPPNECRVPMLLPLDPWGTNTEGLTGCSRPCTHIPGPGGWGPDLLLFLRHSMVSAALVVLVRVRAWAWEREDLRFCYYCLAVRHICYIESKFFFCRLWINFLVFYIHEKHSSFFYTHFCPFVSILNPPLWFLCSCPSFQAFSCLIPVSFSFVPSTFFFQTTFLRGIWLEKLFLALCKERDAKRTTWSEIASNVHAQWTAKVLHVHTPRSELEEPWLPS